MAQGNVSTTSPPWSQRLHHENRGARETADGSCSHPTIPPQKGIYWDLFAENRVRYLQKSRNLLIIREIEIGLQIASANTRSTSLGLGGLSVRKLALAAGLLSLLLVDRPARADAPITFDDLSPSPTLEIPSPYAGLDWSSGFYVMDTALFSAQNGPNGYSNGVVSAPNVAFNAAGDPVTISVPTGTFTLNSVYFTAAWSDGLSITVSGYDGGALDEDGNYVGGGTLLDAITLTVNTTGPTLETFNWTGVTSVLFSASGGNHHSGYIGSGTEFAMDNLTVNSSVSQPSVPEPSAVILLATMLGLVGFRLRVSRTD